MQKLQFLSTRLLLLLCFLLLLTLPALAQSTPEPTAVATPETTPSDAAPTEAAPTAEAPVVEVTIEAPTDSVPNESYNAMLSSLTAIFLALIGVAGAVGGVGIWRAIGIILIVVEAWAKMTPNPKDDEEIAKWRKAYDEKMMAEAAKAGTQAAIGEAIGAEREKLTAKALNFAPKNSVDD